MAKTTQAQKSKSIEIIEETDEYIRCIFRGYPSYFVNTIRRRIINSVETAAVEYIDVLKNTSGLYDEMLAHRLAMIPFTFDKRAIINKNSKECKENPDSARCGVRFVLSKKGPCTVYAKDIKTTHESFKPLYDDIIVVRLLDKQEIDIEGVITLGSGKDHAKYIPAIVGVKEIKEDEEYEMYVETISALSPREILKEAVENIIDDLKIIEKTFK